jgi:hypothetical protein
MNNNSFGNMFALINQYKQFKNNFQGDARAEVQQLLNSGQMTQAQLNQLQNMAKQLQSILK